jgi:CHAT domain-containing protein/Tfp pilus assembly protein PilF
VLEIREKALGPDDRLVALTLDHLSDAYAQSGDYTNAIQSRMRALEIKKKVYGDEHGEVGAELHMLGIVYQDKGDTYKAEEMHLKALSMLEKLNQANTLVATSVLSNLGQIYYSREDYKNAENYFRRSQTILEQRLGPDHFHLTLTLTALGLVAYGKGDYQTAEVMFQRALALTEKNLGPDHVRVPAFLNDLGRLYCTTGDYTKAEEFYQRALSIYRRGGLGSADAQETLFGLARVYAAQGNIPQAVRFEQQASEIENRQVELNLVQGSEREKLAYLGDLSFHSYRNIWLHAQLAPNDPTARTVAVTGILQRKGRVQDTMAESLSALRRRFSVEDQKVLDHLNDVTSKLASLVLHGAERVSPAEHEKQIKNLENQREQLEEEISQRSAGFYRRLPPVSVNTVQAAIPPNAVLIEFAVYQPFDPKAPNDRRAYGPPRYIAYILRNQGEVKWVELGTTKVIDDSVKALRLALSDPDRKDVKQIARKLDQQVTQRIRVSVGNATQLLVSPDGALNLLPFEALVDGSGRYLVERYSVTYLTSGRDLLRMQAGQLSHSNPLVLADPLFGKRAIPHSATENVRQLEKLRPGLQRAPEPSDLSQVYFEPLTNTKLEAEAIKSLFPDVTVMTGAQATEGLLKRVDAPRLLHIATHGFFLTAPSTEEKSGDMSAGDFENPLLRSGLALAGANLRNNTDEDGVLTALEASGLNLWGTKLVTLSACDTGLGEV